MRRRATAAVALALVALALPGCGDDDDGVSREDYAQRVNKVCDQVERDLGALDVTSAKTTADFGDLIDEVIAKSQLAVDRLKALERPSGEAGEAADRFVNTLEREFEKQALPALDQLNEALQTGNRQAVAEAADRISALENANSDRFARQLGADACAA